MIFFLNPFFFPRNSYQYFVFFLTPKARITRSNSQKLKMFVGESHIVVLHVNGMKQYIQMLFKTRKSSLFIPM